MSDVFISYSRKDASFVRKLFDALQRTGRTAWVDWEGIPYSVDWWQEICQGIDAADTFLFVVSPDSMASMICQQEVAYARQQNKRLVPVVYRDVDDQAFQQAITGQDWAAIAQANWQAIRHLNWLFMRDSDPFDTAFADLVKTVEQDPELVRDHTRLLVRAREWDNNARNPSFLLRGDDLDDAEMWLQSGAGRAPFPLPLHTDYIFASRQAERRRQRNILIGVSSALGIAVLLTILSLFLFQDANVQRARADDNAATIEANYRALQTANADLEISAEAVRSEALTAYSIANEDTDIELAFLLALEANRLTSTTGNARAQLAKLLAAAGGSWDLNTVTSEQLVAFAERNVRVRDLTCTERERFNIEPLCGQ